MPLLIPALIGLATFFGGAFIGSQVDDSIDQPMPTPQSAAPNMNKIILYGALAAAGYFTLKKMKVLK